MKLLFTGGCGYIGSHTAYEFLKNTDATLILLDNLSTGFIQNFHFLQENFPNRVRLFKADLNELEKISSLMKEENFDGVIHFGASIVVSESVSNPLKYYINNTQNTTNLISLCVQHQISNFLFSSTAAVYGEPKQNPVDECSPLCPINPYGTSKQMSEQVLQDTNKAHQLNYIILRYFNVAGANADNIKLNGGLGQRSLEATHLIKVASECALGKRKEMLIYGDDYPTKDGTCIRDYIHISDLAKAHLSAYTFLKEKGESQIFNVGYNHGYSVKEVIQTMKKVSGVDFKTTIAPRRDGDPAMLIASNQKLLSLTQWKPQYDDLELICKSAYEWEKSLQGQQ